MPTDQLTSHGQVICSMVSLRRDLEDGNTVAFYGELLPGTVESRRQTDAFFWFLASFVALVDTRES